MQYFKVFITLGIALVIVLVIIFGGNDRREAVLHPFGGIPLRIVAYDRSPAEFEADVVAVKERVGELEGVFNRFNPESEISKINLSASLAPVAVSDDLGSVLSKSYKWHMASGGALDPTVVPLIELWKSSGELGKYPSEIEIESAQGRVGLEEVTITHDSRIMFAKDGMALDFGAVAKGFIADEVARLLKERGLKKGIVDMGGNALAFGGRHFNFGIADPRFSREGLELMGTVEIAEGAVITSGNYERYVTIGGKRYSHIIDPRTGKSIDNGLVAATVIGGPGVDADAMATAFMVLGRYGATKLLEQNPGVSAVLVEQEGDDWRVWVSKGLQSKLKLSDPWADKVQWF